MGQLLYYIPLLFFAWSYVQRYPWLLGLLALALAIRRFLPDPVIYARTAGRIRRLENEIAQNAENATARRDLAMTWLTRNRPRRALPLLVEARRRAPDSAEIAYLLALAYVRAGKLAEALPLCVEAAERDPKLRYGEVFLTAGVALTMLARNEEAEDALLRFLKINASSVEGWTRLAGLRRRAGDAEGAAAALRGAVEAFDQSPRFRRRAQLGWYLRARLASFVS